MVERFGFCVGQCGVAVVRHTSQSLGTEKQALKTGERVVPKHPNRVFGTSYRSQMSGGSQLARLARQLFLYEARRLVARAYSQAELDRRGRSDGEWICFTC
jgi:hypothetical protein